MSLLNTLIKGSVLPFLLLAGCGGGDEGTPVDGGDPAVKTGVFIDSPVQGLSFVTASQGGTTDAEGTFQYALAEKVKFLIGDILIGEVDGARVITPIDLVPGAENELNPAVTNIARFLQTLDNDADLSNGIQIAQATAQLAVGKSVNFAQTILDFENDEAIKLLVSDLTSVTSAGVRTLVPATDAQSHLNASVLGLLGGTWTGTTVYVATTPPYTGDQCEWRIEGQISDIGVFDFNSPLVSATGVGAGYCVSLNGDGQWQRSGDEVTFTIINSSAYLIGGITEHTGQVLEDGQKIIVTGQGVEQGVEFNVTITLYKK